MAEITLVEAVNQALMWEMSHNDDVLVMGEDVGVDGGVFRATVGLLDKFGDQRVLDTPLSETLIGGAAIGMAAQGLMPVAEIQFMGFAYSTIDQMLNHAARMRNRTRGRLTCPMVLRAPFGGGIRAPEHHSESTEVLFAHIPGLRVVIPSSPGRAYGLLLAAIRDPDPVIFLEPKRIYRLVKQEVPDNGEGLPLDVCYVLRPGNDVSVVTWGAMTHEVMTAAEQLAERNVSVEVIDVATLKPLDMKTISESVEKTGRCVIVHEAALSGGWGAEIAAQLAEHDLLNLLAPIKRVTGYDTIMPLYRLEDQYMPSTDRIVNAVNEVLEFA